MENDSGFIDSAGFSASITEPPYFSNSEMDSSTISLFSKADWFLQNEAHLGVLTLFRMGDGVGGGEGQKAQFFPCNFYKRRN